MEHLFTTLPAVVTGLGPNAEVDEAFVFAEWGRCAGELLRVRTAPLDFLESRLVIAVQDETWGRHLEELSPRLLFKLNSSLGEGKVKFIEFRVSPSAINARRKADSKKREIKPDLPISPALAAAADVIADEHLRDQFLKTAAAYLARLT